MAKRPEPESKFEGFHCPLRKMMHGCGHIGSYSQNRTGTLRIGAKQPAADQKNPNSKVKHGGIVWSVLGDMLMVVVTAGKQRERRSCDTGH